MHFGKYACALTIAFHVTLRGPSDMVSSKCWLKGNIFSLHYVWYAGPILDFNICQPLWIIFVRVKLFFLPCFCENFSSNLLAKWFPLSRNISIWCNATERGEIVQGDRGGIFDPPHVQKKLGIILVKKWNFFTNRGPRKSILKLGQGQNFVVSFSCKNWLWLRGWLLCQSMGFV